MKPMKRMFFLLILCGLVVTGSAQDTGKILMVKINEDANTTSSKWRPFIKIVNPDNKIEVDTLEEIDFRHPGAEDRNDQKIRTTLEKITTRGFELKTSNMESYLGPYGYVRLTIYVFERK